MPSPPPAVETLPASPFAWNRHLYTTIPVYTFVAVDDSSETVVLIASPGAAPPLVRTVTGLPPAGATYPIDLFDLGCRYGAPQLDPGALWDFCAASRSIDRLPYRGLVQVACGETVIYSRAGRGWRIRSEVLEMPSPLPAGRVRTIEDAVHACRDVLDDYLGRALRFTSTPVGLTLSAGFDSTLLLDRLVRVRSADSVRAYTHVPTRIDPAYAIDEDCTRAPAGAAQRRQRRRSGLAREDACTPPTV